MRFYVDDRLEMDVDPGSDGFWSLGEFGEKAPGIDNPWKHSGSKMKPFDKEVLVTSHKKSNLSLGRFWVQIGLKS